MAWLLQTLFVVVTVLLLLNMLIAAMAKTFDNVYDSLDMNFVYVKACTTMAVTCMLRSVGLSGTTLPRCPANPHRTSSAKPVGNSLEDLG